MNLGDPATDNCRNCNAVLLPGSQYCPNCGQKVVSARLTLHEIGHDLVHALVHVDRSALSLLRMLLVQPGIVALDYVDGRRKRYFGPFAWLAVAVAVASVGVEVSGFKAIYPDSPNAAVDVLQNFIQRHVNLLFFAQVPFLAAACRLLGLRDRFNYAEYLVLASYTSGMRIFFFAVVVVPLWHTFLPSAATIVRFSYVYLAIWATYFGFATSQFLPKRRLLSAFKGVVAAALTQIGIAVVAGALASRFLQTASSHT
jgi:hypothetical protein